MSSTITPPSAPSRISEWGAVSVSVLSMAVFIAGLVVSYLANDKTAFMLLIGAVITNATTTVNYYLGSSRGSVAKDATISAIATGAPAVPEAPAAPAKVAP